MTEAAKFKAMTESTHEDWMAIAAAHVPFERGLADRLLGHLGEMRGHSDGFAVDRLEHSLQTATRAFQDGRDEEYVVCALLHDIGDCLGPANHAEIGAVILKPYVSEANHWMLDKHGIFQGYYYFAHFGLDPDLREQYRGHACFERTADFCHRYDQNSFDPDFVSMPLAEFRPMVQRIVAMPRRGIYQPTE